MRLEGQFTVQADQTAVYDFLTDPHRISPYIPDVTDVDIQDRDHFTVKAKVGISHIKGTMVMKLEITDRQPPVGTTVVGKGSGLASAVDMVTSFTLGGGEGGATVVNWQGTMNVSGKLASFAPQGLLDRVAKTNIDRLIESIRGGIQDMSAKQPK